VTLDRHFRSQSEANRSFLHCIVNYQFAPFYKKNLIFAVMKQTITIHHNFCGPSESGNGGYSAGLFAKQLDFPAEITLRVPPPLDTPLYIEQTKDKAQLLNKDTLIADAKAVDFELDVPTPPTFEEATIAAKNYKGFGEAPFKNCFVCGANRKMGEGLNIYSGEIAEKKMAAPWIPAKDLATNGTSVDKEYIWAALDCPGAWAVINSKEIIVLGRFAVKVLKEIGVGQKYTVLGWSIDRDGRKIYVGTAIFAEDKTVCAYARATWIALKP